jgi:hypothetical protein
MLAHMQAYASVYARPAAAAGDIVQCQWYWSFEAKSRSSMRTRTEPGRSGPEPW